MQSITPARQVAPDLKYRYAHTLFGQQAVAAPYALATGTVTTVGANVRSTRMQALGGGWYECQLTWLGNANAVAPTLYLASAVGTISYQGTGKYCTLWRSQIEQSNVTGEYADTLLMAFNGGAPRIL